MRAVTVIVAVLAIFVSALAMSPDINHRVLFAHPAVASMADTDAADDGTTQHAPESKCHVGLGCILVVMPGIEMALASFGCAPELPHVASLHPSGAGYPPFHPPRILSQI